jgi:hypothetical protein
MNTEPPLLLELDEANLAHFLSALTLAALAKDMEGGRSDSRRCWWTDDGHFAIQNEQAGLDFRANLFTRAFRFLAAMKWHSGLGGAAHGVLASGVQLGLNPFVTLGGEPHETTPLKGFSARVLPAATLQQQISALKPPVEGIDWLHQRARGVSSWGFDCRVNMHASDAGISSDAEGTSERDPFYPAIELLGLAAAGYFVPCHAWQVNGNSIHASAWVHPIPLPMATFAATGQIRGLPTRTYAYTYRRAAHGKGGAYHFFPPATLQETHP